LCTLFAQMLEFSAANGITPDVELINADQVNDAFSQIITQSNLKPRYCARDVCDKGNADLCASLLGL
jgi:D-arabinose 1-dehydrogenase-like Zn-dependent alcohol dehydrogenase